MNSQALWYLARGSGVAALILLTVSVLAGLATESRWSSARWPRFVVEGLHKNLSLLGPVFLVVHIVSAVADSYVPISWLSAFVPFGASYRPFWLGMGALSLDLFLAVAVTSLLRSRLGYRRWRSVHWLAYGSWGLAIVHGLGTGSDRHQTWFVILNMAAVASVVVAAALRFSRDAPPGGPRRLQPAPVPVRYNPRGARR